MPAAVRHATINITPEMISRYLWEGDHLLHRGTCDYELALDIIQHKTYVLDEHARHINGRYIKIAFMELSEAGKPVVTGDEVQFHWKRVRIPKRHPWRDERPTRSETSATPPSTSW